MLGVGGTALTDLRRELLGWNQLAVTAFRSITINAAQRYDQGRLSKPIGTVLEDHPTLSWVSYFLPLALFLRGR